jgi:hypothetical protein
MPLKLNVGASRKVADDHYGSRGASVNLEVEFDCGLIADPAKLQDRIRRLFALVRVSLAEELNAPPKPPASNGSDSVAPANQPVNGGHRKNGQQNGSPRLATPAQIKAIIGITNRLGIDLHEMLQERCRVERLEELSIKQASSLIDSLNSSSAPPDH